MFLGLFALAACQSQQKPDETSAAQTDTVPTEKIAERKEPVIIENLPGIDAPVIMDEDTVYTNVDTPPVFSEGDLNDYFRDLPHFTPASLNGELVNYRMVVAVRFK